ncbi:MAG: hypothetical protein ABIF77_12970 [bacterium]
MLKRVMLSVGLMLILCSSAASAITVDAGLKEALADKAPGSQIRVLLLLDNPADLSALEATLGETDWRVRRLAVTTQLKDHARLNQAEPLAVLDDAKRAGHVGRIKPLWLANAIAFEGDQTALDALTALDLKGVLVHDKPHDMISSVLASKEPIKSDGSDPVTFSQAKDDTVWGVKWIYAHDVWTDLATPATASSWPTSIPVSG